MPDYLREMLKQRAVSDVKPDDKVVEQLYRGSREGVEASLGEVEKEDDAKAFVKEIEQGGDFGAVAENQVKAGKAEGGEKGRCEAGRTPAADCRGHFHHEGRRPESHHPGRTFLHRDQA